jgi:Tol biopolymer transport system component
MPQDAGAYMSPEEAEGRRTDFRSDIFSFGALVNEMAGPEVPRELGRIIERCLHKNPARRYQHVDEVKLALERVKEGAATKPRRIPMRWALAGGAVLALLLVMGIGRWLRAPAGNVAQGYQLKHLTTESGLAMEPAISSDGRSLAYAADRGSGTGLDIWVRAVSDGEAARITTDEADDHEPDISPDGARVVYRSERDGGGAYIVPARGAEPPRLVAEGGRNPRFSPDGRWVAYWTGEPNLERGSKIWVVPLGGGAPVSLCGECTDARYPVWSADSKQLLFVGDSQGGDWWIAPIDGGKAKRSGAYRLMQMHGFNRGWRGRWRSAPIPAAWTPTGAVFAARQDRSVNLWRLPFSPELMEFSGTAQRLTSAAGYESSPSMSSNGRIVFASRAASMDVWSLPVDANAAKVLGEPVRLTRRASAALQPSISLDGKKVVYRSIRGDNREIYLTDLESGKESLLSSEQVPQSPPVISASGKKVAYRTRPGLVIRDADSASTQGEFACRDCFRPWHLSPDESRLLYQPGFGRPSRISVYHVASKERWEAVRHPRYEVNEARFSPDTKWVVFNLVRAPGQRQVFIVPYQDRSAPLPESEWIRVTPENENSYSANWSPDGSLLYFLSDRDGFVCIWAQRLDRGKHSRGQAFAVRHFHHARHLLDSDSSPGEAGLSVARNRVVFGLWESAGNVWMLEPTGRK